MRRWVGLALAALGAFLVVGAVLLRFYVPGQVMLYPLNEYISTTLQGTGMSYFSASMGRPVTGAAVRATSTLKGDAAQGSAGTAVWDNFTYLYDASNHAPIAYQVRRLAFDRRTGQLVSCCGANVDGNPEVRQYGLGEFPVGTQPVTYQLYDPVLEQTQPARYAGTGTVGGITAYRFVERVPSTRQGTLLAVPASLVGLSGASDVTLTEYYQATNTFWVDPVTGAQLNVSEDQKVSYADASGVQRMVSLAGTLRMAPQSVQALVSLDNSARGKVTLLTVVLPLAGGLTGLAIRWCSGTPSRWLAAR